MLTRFHLATITFMFDDQQYDTSHNNIESMMLANDTLEHIQTTVCHWLRHSDLGLNLDMTHANSLWQSITGHLNIMLDHLKPEELVDVPLDLGISDSRDHSVNEVQPN